MEKIVTATTLRVQANTISLCCSIVNYCVHLPFCRIMYLCELSFLVHVCDVNDNRHKSSKGHRYEWPLKSEKTVKTELENGHTKLDFIHSSCIFHL